MTKKIISGGTYYTNSSWRVCYVDGALVVEVEILFGLSPCAEYIEEYDGGRSKATVAGEGVDDRTHPVSSGGSFFIDGD